MNGRFSHRMIYWAYQMVGWGGYVGFFGLLSWGQGTYDVAQGAMLLITMVVGMVCSHALRATIHQKQWVDLPMLRLVPRMLLAITMVGLLATLCQAALHDVLLTAARPILGGGGFRLVELVIAWVLVLSIWSTFYFVHQHLVRRRREEIQLLRMEAADRANQLANLRSQMNPHFMFNALNGIRALVDEDPGRAKQAITRLSAILRNAMVTVKRVTVPLGEELDMVKAYLELEHMRYEERLRFTVDVDPALEREPVPPMMLQTLVENAVKHGVAKRPEGGSVHVTAHRARKGIVLVVTNSGELNTTPVEGTGIGLSNTKERLQRIYGEHAALTIEERDGMVVTEVAIPDHAVMEPNEP